MKHADGLVQRGTALRSRLRELLHVRPVWGKLSLRWCPGRGRHYDEALERHHTDAEEAQLQREHAERVHGKQLYGKAITVLRFLRAHGGQPAKFLKKVAKDITWVDKIHDTCWRKWGGNPPSGGGSEEYSDEILDLSAPEWLNTEDGEWVPTPSLPPSSTGEDRPSPVGEEGGEAANDVQLGDKSPSPQSGLGKTTALLFPDDEDYPSWLQMRGEGHSIPTRKSTAAD